MLLNVVFTVKSTLAGGAALSNTLFVGADPTFTNANNLVLTSDSSTGINIAKQFVAQVCNTLHVSLFYKQLACNEASSAAHQISIA